MSARRVRALVGALAVAVLAVVAVLGLSPAGAPGRRAPALPREGLSGPHTTLASTLAAAHGRPVLVLFWASWCPPCAQEAPEDERFYRAAAGAGRLVAVDWSDPNTGNARAFVRRYGWSFPVLRDEDGRVGRDYRVSSMPNTFVVDARGRIRKVLRGPQTVASLRAALAAVENS